MKISNVKGDKTKKSLGKQVTTSSWKGRSYMKTYKEPAQPNTGLQEEKRDFFSDGVGKWQNYNIWRKYAYTWHRKYFRKDITDFNIHIQLYLITKNEGKNYVNPRVGTNNVIEPTHGDPIEGARLLIKLKNNARIYAEGFTDSNGRWKKAVLVWDQNYDIHCSAAGYEDSSQLNMKARVVVDTTFTMIPL